MFNPLAAIKGMFRKGRGERKLLAMLNNNASMLHADLWNTNRLRYPQKFSGWHYVAIDAIASEIAGMSPIYAYKRDDGDTGSVQKCLSKKERKKALTGLQSQVELEPVSQEHPLIRLNARPNAIDVAFTYWYKVIMFLRTCGECYVWDVPNVKGEVSESWVLPAHWIWPVPGKSSLIDEYEVRPVASWMPTEGGNWYWFGGATGKWKIPADQIIPFFLPGPHTLAGGYAPPAAAAAWTDSADNVDSSRVFKFQNDSFPNVAIVFDKDIEPDSISQPEIDRLKIMIKEKYSGVKRTGEPAILGPGMSMQVLSATPKDMDYCEGFAQMRDSIMAAHRTGTIVVGMSNETTHAAGRAARAGWHSSTITPLVKYLGQVVTEYRCRKYDEDLVCFWMDSAPEDIEFEQKQRVEFLDRDVLTIDEARAQVGLEPHPNREIGPMTLSEVAAKFAVPTGIGEEPGLLTDENAGNNDRMGNIFESKNGNGNGSLLNGDKKMKALTDLRNELLLR